MAGFCTQCGSGLPDGVVFCTQCGARKDQTPPPTRNEPMPRNTASPAPAPAGTENTPDRTVSTGSFFGLLFLFALPVIGWLCCAVMAFVAKNRNIRHFARAMLIWLVIALVLSLLLGLAVNAMIRVATPYLEQAVAELGGLLEGGELGDLSGLAGLLEELENLTGIMEGLETVMPTE